MNVDQLEQVAAWCKALTPDEAAEAAKGTNTKTFARGQHVCHLADHVDAWHGVVSGILRLGLVSDAGQLTGFTSIRAGGWFGEGSILKDEPRQYDIVAVTDAEVAVMRGQTFRWLCAHSVGFNHFLVQQLNERLGQFIATVGHDRMRDAQTRLARTIGQLSNDILYPFASKVVEMPQEELGVLANLSRQTTNKLLQQLEQQGLISVLPNGLEILDLEGLQTYGESAD